jgi:hypothetical protein
LYRVAAAIHAERFPFNNFLYWLLPAGTIKSRCGQLEIFGIIDILEGKKRLNPYCV